MIWFDCVLGCVLGWRKVGGRCRVDLHLKEFGACVLQGTGRKFNLNLATRAASAPQKMKSSKQMSDKEKKTRCHLERQVGGQVYGEGGERSM